MLIKPNRTETVSELLVDAVSKKRLLAHLESELETIRNEKCTKGEHQWAEEEADAESGSSTLYCGNCGFSEEVYF